MKKYWKGFLLLLCGTLPFLFIYASRFLPYDNGAIEKALALLKEQSPELPPEVKDLLPPYPGATGNIVAVLPELISVNSVTQDTREQVLQFYQVELAKLGWLGSDCNEPDDGLPDSLCFKRGTLELMVAATVDLIFGSGTGIILSLTDTATQFHPSQENDPQAQDIINTVAETYRTCSSYRDENSALWNLVQSDGSIAPTTTRDYKTVFLRPGRFRLSVVKDGNTSLGSVRIVHTDASGIQEYDGAFDSILTHDSLADALEDGEYVPLLLNSEEIHPPLDLAELEKPEEETIEGTPCWKIRGKDKHGQAVTLWIDKGQHILRLLRKTDRVNDTAVDLTVSWTAQVNVPVSDEELAFRPFGKIPIPVGKALIALHDFWVWTPVLHKLGYLLGGCLFMSGFLYMVRIWRNGRKVRLNGPRPVGDD